MSKLYLIRWRCRFNSPCLVNNPHTKLTGEKIFVWITARLPRWKTKFWLEVLKTCTKCVLCRTGGLAQEDAAFTYSRQYKTCFGLPWTTGRSWTNVLDQGVLGSGPGLDNIKYIVVHIHSEILSAKWDIFLVFIPSGQIWESIGQLVKYSYK